MPNSNVNVSHEALYALLDNTSTKSNKICIDANIRNQPVWFYIIKINNVENYLFITYHEANYIKANNKFSRLSGFVPHLFKTTMPSMMPVLDWNHTFDSVVQSHQRDTIMTITTMFLVLRSSFVPDPTYLNTFLSQFDIPTLIDYYKTL